MSWRYLFPEAFELQKQKTEDDRRETAVATDSSALNDDEENYQKKLFENDLYVWSLLLLLPNKESE
jgi:hypothetical protein